MTIVLVVLMAIGAAEWNVVDYGAAGDGETDSTAAFQRALDDAAASGGGLVQVPAGQYRFSGVLSIPGAVTLQGTFRVPPTDQREGRVPLDGSVLMPYAGRGSQEGNPFIRLAGSMATLAGFMITYPEWKEADVPPVPYPPTVYAAGVVNVGILDCGFLNSYEAIHFQDTGRFLVRNVYGYPSRRGLYVDNCLDIGRVENCHFWPFGVVYGQTPYTQWINLNGTAFEFARTDWQYVLNTFCFGYGVGYKFSTSKNGSCNGNFVGIGADCCTRSVVVDTVPGSLDLLIVNGEFVGRWGSTDSIGVEVVGRSTGRVSLNNCAFWGPLDRCIWARAPHGNVAATACGFLSWDVGAQNAPAVQIDGGKAILQGNTFDMEGLNIRIGEDTVSAILIGNQAPVGLVVDNRAGDRTQMYANELDRFRWLRGAKRHYVVDVGTTGDNRYLRGFHAKETGGHWGEDSTMRWGGPAPRLILPVEPGKPYTLKLDVYIPSYARAPDSGVFLGEARLANLSDREGFSEITVSIPAQGTDAVEVRIRAQSWTPIEKLGSNDGRTLTVALNRVQMKTRRAPKRVFNGNDGTWFE